MTQANKHQKKVDTYKKRRQHSYAGYWAQLSKIPAQVWRFFKNWGAEFFQKFILYSYGL